MLSFAAANPSVPRPRVSHPCGSMPQPITSHLRCCNPHRRVSSALPGFSVSNQCPASPPHSLAAPPPCHSLPQPGFSELLLRLAPRRSAIPSPVKACLVIAYLSHAPADPSVSQLFRFLSGRIQAIPPPVRSNPSCSTTCPIKSAPCLCQSVRLPASPPPVQSTQRSSQLFPFCAARLIPDQRRRMRREKRSND